MIWLDSALPALAGAILLCWGLLCWETARGNRRVTRLASVPPRPDGPWPRVSIVFAARNEAATLGAAVPTMLAMDYPELEVIAVNDRSDDATGSLLDALARAHPRLRVIHVAALPPGWIGKNHALHAGAAAASGQWILFTDADIHFSPAALRRAVTYAETGGYDLVAAVPQLHEQGHFLGLCVHAFSFVFTTALRPWRVPDPRYRLSHGSVGAFGLVRAVKYRELGGHERIRLRPDDDIKLGKLFKMNGARCAFVFGNGAISVAWYETTRQMIRGLTKNTFAGADYQPWAPPLFALAVALFILCPLAALFLTTGLTWGLSAASVAAMIALSVDQTRFTGGPAWHALLLPVGISVFAYILFRSMVVTYWTRGITWRGTHYPLSELRRNVL